MQHTKPIFNVENHSKSSCMVFTYMKFRFLPVALFCCKRDCPYYILMLAHVWMDIYSFSYYYFEYVCIFIKFQWVAGIFKIAQANLPSVWHPHTAQIQNFDEQADFDDNS